MQQPINLQDAIFNLQKYLRALSYTNDAIIPPPVDGIFDSATERSVRSFQEAFGLNANGIVDKSTWDAIYGQYLIAQEKSEDLPFFPSSPRDYSASLGEESAFVAIVQILLRELSVIYDGFPTIEISGKFDSPTESAIKELQRASGLAPTGLLDKITYKRLLYDLSRHASF